MPKKIIKRFLPDHHTVRNQKCLRCFGSLLHDPNIWHLNRHSVAGAFAVGLFCAYIPVPFQMLVAAALAIMVRVNLPVAVSLVWITNPITIPPMFYFAYKVGSWVLNSPTHAFNFELSIDWLMVELGIIWQPFLLGCFILGTILAALGYGGIKLLWRLHILQHIKQRRLRHAARRRRKQKTTH